ncbi:MAG: hypothetical protein M1272_06685 [Firmicutes bacterium]|nr:hypothetical protein [Bacillota bacterium]
MIPFAEIIGIFQRSLVDRSPEFRHLFHRWRVEGRVWGDWDEAKTVILTEEYLYLSSISAHTLLRRVERHELQFE